MPSFCRQRRHRVSTPFLPCYQLRTCTNFHYFTTSHPQLPPSIESTHHTTHPVSLHALPFPNLNPTLPRTIHSPRHVTCHRSATPEHFIHHQVVPSLLPTTVVASNRLTQPLNPDLIPPTPTMPNRSSHLHCDQNLTNPPPSDPHTRQSPCTNPPLQQNQPPNPHNTDFQHHRHGEWARKP